MKMLNVTQSLLSIFMAALIGLSTQFLLLQIVAIIAAATGLVALLIIAFDQGENKKES